MSSNGCHLVSAVHFADRRSLLRDMHAVRNSTAVTRLVAAGMPDTCKIRMPRYGAACCFAGTFKSHDRVKSLVTLASGFPVICGLVNTATKRLDYLKIHE